MDRVVVLFKLDREVRKQVRVLALEQDTSMQKIIEKLVVEYVEEESK